MAVQGAKESEVRFWMESLRTMGMRPGLEVTSVLLTRLGMPQMKFPSIHVAGSNGKGSCCVILANALSLSGISCGLFTSPHLCFVEERIRIDGVPISTKSFDSILQRVKDAADQHPSVLPSYYEVTFLVAMMAFAEAGVDRAVIETGLGGRLDSTRLCYADACVLTELALEHTDILGDTLEKIATEKAAIYRPGCLFIARWNYDDGARNAIENSVVDHSKAWWWRYDRAMGIRFDMANESHRPIPDFEGFDGWAPYQKEAARLAKMTLDMLHYHDAAEMVESAVLHTVWPGRMQRLEYKGVPLLIDAAHNPSGMEKVCEQLRIQMESDIYPTPGVIIFGCTPQSDIVGFIQPLIELIVDGEIKHVLVTEPQKGRRPAVSSTELLHELESQGASIFIEKHPQPSAALERALELAGVKPVQPILALGSLYLVGNLLEAMGLDDVHSMTVLRPVPENQYWT